MLDAYLELLLFMILAATDLVGLTPGTLYTSFTSCLEQVRYSVYQVLFSVSTAHFV